MWATHPANHDREVNAKIRYIRSPKDDRPAWALFRTAAELRETITRRLYEVNRKEKIGTFEDPEAVQAFIDAEHAETTYHPKYHGLYDNRYVKPGELADLCVQAPEFEEASRLALAHSQLYNEVKERMEAHKSRHEEAGKLAQLVHGGVQLRGRDFEHRGSRFQLAEARYLLKDVEAEIDRDYEWMHVLDRAVFHVHYAMAAQLGVGDLGALEERYRFHLALQALYSQLTVHNAHVQRILAEISGQRQVQQQQFQEVIASLRQAHTTLDEQLAVADEMILPALTNITAGARLGPYLLGDKLVKNIPSETTTLEGAWIQRFLSQMGEVIDRTQRMVFKSLGGLLAFEESLAERWHEKQSNAEARQSSVEAVPYQH